jgi:multidrug efflux system membrane fusion protein
MASRLFRPSRWIAVAVALAATAWILSGRFGPEAQEETGAASAEKSAPAVPVQKVAVTTATPEEHARQVVLSCVTRADHRAQAVARGAGVIVTLSVERGTPVKAGQVIANISDEGRVANVAQAKAMLDQRMSEYENNKKLIDRGDAPRNNLAALESAVAGARAVLAAAQAEADRSAVKAPIDGIVDTVPVQIGQAVQVGMEIAEIVDPDPMLAVGAVSEARRGLLEKNQTAEVRFIDGRKAPAVVVFVGLSADKATRTYPVEAKMDNADGLTADGVTCELVVTLQPKMAAAVPRSALVFSDDGLLGVRIADADNKVKFVALTLVDDAGQQIWVTGIDAPSRVIVVGQDFVKDGDTVEAVTEAEMANKATVPPA